MDGYEQAEKESMQDVFAGMSYEPVWIGGFVLKIWKGLGEENIVRKDLIVENFQGQVNTFGVILRIIGALKRFWTETWADEIVEQDCSIKYEDGLEGAGSRSRGCCENQGMRLSWWQWAARREENLKTQYVLVMTRYSTQ